MFDDTLTDQLPEVVHWASNNMNVVIYSSNFSECPSLAPKWITTRHRWFHGGLIYSFMQVVSAHARLPIKTLHSLFTVFVASQPWICFSILSAKIKILFSEDTTLLVSDIDSYDTRLLSLIVLPVFSFKSFLRRFDWTLDH